MSPFEKRHEYNEHAEIHRERNEYAPENNGGKRNQSERTRGNEITAMLTDEVEQLVASCIQVRIIFRCGAARAFSFFSERKFFAGNSGFCTTLFQRPGQSRS